VAESKDDKPTQNIFQIMDQIVHQLNKTKKMFLIMIVSIVVVVPATFIVTFALAGGSSFWNDGPPWDGPPRNGGGPSDGSAFGIARGIVIVFVLAWIVIGIRQWFVLSKWTQRYEIYKELQKKIDEKLDYDNDEGKRGGGGQRQ
jgi:cell division protein FtsL